MHDGRTARLLRRIAADSLPRVKAMTPELHARRLHNFADINAALGGHPCHFVSDYLPGQVVYNLSEYPVPTPLAPTAYDEELLRSFADAGVGLIQIHEDFNDSQRVLGADKFSSYDPEGLQRFVDLVHSLGMKIIPYISSGYFDIRDPDFDERWYDSARGRLIELYFDYARCSPASPQWRAYLLSKVERLLDGHAFDGLYNDMGYDRSRDAEPLPEGQVRPGPPPHAAIEDLLEQLYSLAHRRGGVVKLHGFPFDIAGRAQVYDYVWVGEGVASLDKLRQETQSLPPYVVPCPDMSRAEVIDEHELYRQTIPYMQFPLRVDGRPVTGERASVAGVPYQPEDRCFWTRHMRAIGKHFREHPEGPHTYGWWDSCPGRAEARQVWLDYFALYRPMVTPGSRVWVDVPANAIFDWRLPEEVVASFFVNEETYLVLANHGAREATVASRWQWEPLGAPASREGLSPSKASRQPCSRIVVQPRQLLFLRRVQHD